MGAGFNNNHEFLTLFEAIKLQVNVVAGVESREMLLKQACDRSNRVKARRLEIERIREVRNVIAHPDAKSKSPSVFASDDLIERAKSLLRAISLDRTASKTGVSIADLYVATATTRLAEVTEVMRQNLYSHVPVLDGARAVIGVFNEASVFDYLMKQRIVELTDTMIVDDVIAHCHLNAGHTETFRFIAPNTSEDEMYEALLTVNGPYTRVGALFVTPSGKPNEPLHRMITVWDLMSEAA